MKLVKARVKGYRCFSQLTEIEFGPFIALAGRNDAGKSSFLEALAVFFEELELDAGDVCVTAGEEKLVEITCEFDDLPPELVIDADHPTTLKAEYLLNEHHRLEVTKIFDGALRAPKLKGTFVRASHPSQEKYRDLHCLKITSLRARADELGVDLTGVTKTVNAALRRAIWAHGGGNLTLESQSIAVDEDGMKKIWDQLKAYLPLFALFKADRPSTDQDAEAQDPMKLAVSTALKAQEQELEAIRATVEAKVLEVATQTVKKLAEIDPTLAQTLTPIVQRPNWASAFKIGLSDEVGVPINKRGSGVRRLILLNFFRAQAEQKTLGNQSGIIYAIEEPETSQHPINQKLLLKAFFELSEQPGVQVAITTHNPSLARSLPIDCLRFLRVRADRQREVLSNHADVFALACKEFGVLPDNSVKAFIGVEGTNDISFLREISTILSATEPDIPNLAEADHKGEVIFIPLNGSNLQSWLHRLQPTQRPEFHFFDRDIEPPSPPRYSAEAAVINARQGCRAVHTDTREAENYIHADAINEHWPGLAYADAGRYSDVPTRLAHITVTAAGANFAQLSEKARKAAIAGIKRDLNSQVVKRMSAERLTQTDPGGIIRGFLREIRLALIA